MKWLSKIKKSKMKIYNIWSWPAELIDDIRQWLIVRKALKEDSTKTILSQYKYPLRIDKIGRVYTVINVPEELIEYEKSGNIWPWILEQLRELDSLLMSLRLNDLLYPDVKKLSSKDYPNSFAYRVVLASSTESLSIWKFLRWLLNLSFVSFCLYLINSISMKVLGSGIIELFVSLL